MSLHISFLCSFYYLMQFPMLPISITVPYVFLLCHLSSLRAFMAGAASLAGDADSSRAPGLTYGLLGSVNVHRGALLLVPQ